MKKKFRNKDCKECPKNKREDIVWRKGYEDGIEIGLTLAKDSIDNLLKWKKT